MVDIIRVYHLFYAEREKTVSQQVIYLYHDFSREQFVPGHAPAQRIPRFAPSAMDDSPAR